MDRGLAVKLRLDRFDLQPAYTMGRLYVDDVLECLTLEDAVRDGPKVPGATAIPAGTYPVQVTYSNRFGKPMPLIADVPGFAGIRIHSGNTVADTEGCILVGKMRVGATVQLSREAFAHLFPKIQAAQDAGQSITIDITNEPEEAAT